MNKKVAFVPMLTMILCLLTIVAPAYAVQGTIKLVGSETRPIPGSTFSISSGDGETITGSVATEDDDKAGILRFDTTSADRRAVSATVMTNTGSRTYQIEDWSPSDNVTINLDTGAVTASGAALRSISGSGSERRFSFGVGVSGGVYSSDFFVKAIDNNVAALRPLITSAGGTNIVTSGSADDSGSTYGADISFRWSLNERNDISLRVGYQKFSNLDGTATGTADVAGNTLEITGTGSSEFETYDVALRFAREFGDQRKWGWYVDLGSTFADVSDSSRTVTLFNGAQVDSFELSASDDDNAILYGGGLFLRPGGGSVPGGWEYGVGISQTGKLFQQESVQRIHVAVSFYF